MVKQPQVEIDAAAIRSYLLTEPAMRRDEKWVRSLDLPRAQFEFIGHVTFVWQRLTNLSRMYEEFGREWFLPTSLSDALADF